MTKRARSVIRTAVRLAFLRSPDTWNVRRVREKVSWCAALEGSQAVPPVSSDGAPAAGTPWLPGGSFLPAVIAGDRAAASGKRQRWWPQFVLLAMLLWALDAVDKFRAGVQSAGLTHAAVVASISGRFGGGAALAMNQWLASHPLPAAASAAYYVVLHVLVTGTVGLFLLRSQPPGFRSHRNALIAMGLIALLVFWLYPVAPPRMLPGYHDITAASVPVFSHLLETRAADQFAALPSLHVAWALWVATVSRTLVRRPIWRAAVWAYPVLTTVDVLATANHYMLDVVSAPVVLLLAYTMTELPSHVRLRRVKVPGWFRAVACLATQRHQPGGRTSRSPNVTVSS